MPKFSKSTQTKFGGAINFSGTRSQVKLKLDVKGFNLNECTKIYHKMGINLTNGMQICAGGEGGKDSCNGDSGKSIEILNWNSYSQ